MHHFVEPDGLAGGQVEDAVRELLPIVVEAEFTITEHERVIADACAAQEVVSVVDLVAMLPLAGT